MIVLVPTRDTQYNASIFHDDLLGAQRYQANQVISALDNVDNPNFSHPTVRQWRSHTLFLVDYAITMTTEWMSRGRQDNLLQKLLQYRNVMTEVAPQSVHEPEWWLDDRLNFAHQAYLVRKWPQRYRPMFPHVKYDLPMVYLGPENEQAQAIKEEQRAKRAAERAQKEAEQAEQRRKELEGDDDAQ